jgi:site-specific recombinase XerD
MGHFMTTTIALPSITAGDWEKARLAFLAEKHRHSGSMRTVTSYSRLLDDFFTRAGRAPDEIEAPAVFAWAYGIGASGREPASTTVGARLACLSSFYSFLIRMELVDRNPGDAVERPKVRPSVPPGLTADEVRKLLSVVDATTPTGARTVAVIFLLVLTGRRRSEILNLTAGDVTFDGEVSYYTFRGKGGKTGRRELPAPALAAIETMLATEGRGRLAGLPPEEHIFLVSQHAVYLVMRRAMKRAGLNPAGLHIFRHSAAKLRRGVGATVEEVSGFLDHSSLAVTSVYLKRLEGEADLHWRQVAALLA